MCPFDRGEADLINKSKAKSRAEHVDQSLRQCRVLLPETSRNKEEHALGHFKLKINCARPSKPTRRRGNMDYDAMNRGGTNREPPEVQIPYSVCQT